MILHGTSSSSGLFCGHHRLIPILDTTSTSSRLISPSTLAYGSDPIENSNQPSQRSIRLQRLVIPDHQLEHRFRTLRSDPSSLHIRISVPVVLIPTNSPSVGCDSATNLRRGGIISGSPPSSGSPSGMGRFMKIRGMEVGII